MGLTKEEWRELYFKEYIEGIEGAARTLVKHNVLTSITTHTKLGRSEIPEELLNAQIDQRRIARLIRDLQRLEKTS